MFSSSGSGTPLTGGDQIVAVEGSYGNNDSYEMGTAGTVASRGKSGEAGGNQSHSHKFSITDTGATTGANNPPWHGFMFLIKD
jgi:hypothetical protein